MLTWYHIKLMLRSDSSAGAKNPQPDDNQLLAGTQMTLSFGLAGENDRLVKGDKDGLAEEFKGMLVCGDEDGLVVVVA